MTAREQLIEAGASEIIGAGIRDPWGHTHLTWNVCRPPATEYALSRGAAPLTQGGVGGLNLYRLEGL